MEAAGNLPASLVDVNHCNKMVYNTGSGGGGNCTRVLFPQLVVRNSGYDIAPGGWAEHGREDVALRELVANWHRLTPSVRTAIMDLTRGD